VRRHYRGRLTIGSMTESINSERNELEIGRAAFLKSSALAVAGIVLGYAPFIASGATGELGSWSSPLP
jgi:hypothetical protein